MESFLAATSVIAGVHDLERQESRLRSDRDRGHASESASADLGIAGRWREAALHLHRDPLGVQPQDREARARNPPLGRKDRVHRSKQNRNVSVGGRVKRPSDDRPFRVICPPPATWGFRMDSGQRGSRSRSCGATGRASSGPPTDNSRPRGAKCRHGTRGPSPHMGQSDR